MESLFAKAFIFRGFNQCAAAVLFIGVGVVNSMATSFFYYNTQTYWCLFAAYNL